MGTSEERAAYDRQLKYLADTIARLESEMPSGEELAYLRNRKEADERAAWAWRVIKQYAPWVASAASAIGVAAWYVLTHTITVNTSAK